MIANAVACSEELIRRGYDIDVFAPRLSFFLSAHNDFFEEIAKYRAARRIYCKIMKERFAPKDPRSLMFRFHVQTAGVALTAQQPLNNIARETIYAMAAIFSGTRSLNLACFDEVYAIAGNYRCPQALPAHPDYYDNVVLTALFKNGMQGIIDGAASVSYGYDARVEVLGSTGVLFIGRLAENSVLSCAEGQGLNQSVIRSWRHLFHDAYEAEDREFIECIQGDRPPKVGGRDGMMAVGVVNAGNNSIRTKKPVKVTILE